MPCRAERRWRHSRPPSCSRPLQPASQITSGSGRPSWCSPQNTHSRPSRPMPNFHGRLVLAMPIPSSFARRCSIVDISVGARWVQRNKRGLARWGPRCDLHALAVTCNGWRPLRAVRLRRPPLPPQPLPARQLRSSRPPASLLSPGLPQLEEWLEELTRELDADAERAFHGTHRCCAERRCAAGATADSWGQPFLLAAGQQLAQGAAGAASADSVPFPHVHLSP